MRAELLSIERTIRSAETLHLVEGNTGHGVMGETQPGSTVSMELMHVRKTFVGTWEGSASSRRVVRRDRIGEGGNRSR